MTSTISIRTTRSALVALLLAIAGCGGGGQGLSHTFPDDRPEDVRAVLARVEAAGPRQDPAIVVGLTPAPMRLWVWDLESGRMLWEQETAAETVPQVAGRSIVVQEGTDIVVRRIEDGAVTARFADHELSLAGADGEGDLAVISLSTGGAVGARSRVLALRGGSVAWQLELEQAIGEPAVRAGMIFLPWAQQNLSVLDGASGAELARVRFTRGVVGHAIAQDASVFFGQRGIARLTDHTSSASDAPFFEPLERELPGDPGMLRDAYTPPPSPSSAAHRVRLVWRAAAAEGGSEVGLQDDTLYLVFYRIVFALEASAERVRWVAQLDSDAVGATAEEGGLLIVDEQGRVRALSRDDGRVTFTAETGSPASWAHVAHARFAAGAPQGDAMPIRDQLLAASQSTDARLVPARAYAARLLASLPEPEVTASLISLCDDRNLPAQLHVAACEALAMRENGTEHVLEALGRHASYLEGTGAPPAGALARSAARARETRAVPLLIGQLRDPQTPPADLAMVAEALRALGDRSAADPLEDFVRLYHAEAPDDDLARALAAVITTYAALAGPASQETLRWVIEDAASMPAARAAAQQALTALEAGPVATETAEPVADTAVTSVASSPELPARITTPIVTSVLAPVADDLRACLVTPGRTYAQGRIVLAIEPDGALHTVSVTPPELQACLEPVVRSTTFPATRAGARQTITHTLRR